MTLGNQRLGEIVGPAGFGAFDLDKGGVDGVVGRLCFAALDEVGHVGEAFVDLVLITRVATKEEIVHVEAIRHDLVAHGLKDRKSTRLNSSHGYISYAVFCLKKK